MQVMDTVRCTGCGATVALDSSHTACQRCGQTHHDGAHKTPAKLEADLNRILDTGLAQVERKLKTNSQLGMAIEPMAVVVGLAVGGTFFALLIDRFESGLWRLGIMVGGAIIFFVATFGAMAMGYASGHLVHLWQRRQINTAIKLSRQKAACPSCGAPVSIPGGKLSLQCTHCDAHLLANDGMVVVWQGDIHKAIAAWKDQAERIAAKVSGTSNTLGSFAVVSAFAVILALCALAYFVS